ncbi:hypothetical protein BDY19DRAFT_959416 [Irpex rosettiformis]|uniref:Uncharacterized protein n=1 Tax=Irpex rosettiformis TaxID=378272 RepID=A0ACB8TX68_9APHY|nr:hypothetical protein BDY19DRAFT_959416 [Irpex rosettiformis]
MPPIKLPSVMQHRQQRSARRTRQRTRRAGASSSIIKRTSSQPSHAKKKLLERVKPRKIPTGTKSRRTSFHLALQKQKATRERWAAIALETQEIVLGSGQYVVERYCPPTSPSTSTAIISRPSSPIPASSYIKHIGYDIFPQIQLSRQNTVHYPHYSEQLAFWDKVPPSSSSTTTTSFDFVHSSTLSAARQLSIANSPSPIGVLSFASPKRPASGYLNGADEQEDVIARHSSLIASLTADSARGFYQEHRFYKNDDGSGLHDHSMLYSPGVVAFRADPDDSGVTDSIGGDFIPPYAINVVSAVPVNAAMVRAKHIILPSEQQLFEDGIRSAMKERMARALRILEDKGNRTVILGAFGCGSFQNSVEAIASIWAELLVCGQPEKDGARPARYKDIFDRVVFAVPGKLFEPFKTAFEMRVFEAEVAAAALSD